jgi:glycosyltransferase involved in cell wall biosynthesis
MAEKAKIAVLACTNVIGGHEFQTATLVRDLVRHADVTVYVNQEAHHTMFAETGAVTVSLPGLLLRPGNLLKQVHAGLTSRASLRRHLGAPDMVLISAGAVEAGVGASIALYGWAPLSLYLPFFYDRVPVWGPTGYLYNFVLSRFCGFYRRIVTINRIQATVIRAMTGAETLVIPNLIRHVMPAPAEQTGRMLFVGRLDHQKRVDELIQWTDFAENPFKELVVIGDGPLRPLLEEQANRTRYVRVKFMGWQSSAEQDAMIDGNDVLVLNSLLEGEPLVIREARKRGNRILARSITGVRGVTKPGERFASKEDLQRRLTSLQPRRAQLDVKETSATDVRRREAAVQALRLAR